MVSEELVQAGCNGVCLRCRISGGSWYGSRMGVWLYRRLGLQGFEEDVGRYRDTDAMNDRTM